MNTYFPDKAEVGAKKARHGHKLRHNIEPTFIVAKVYNYMIIQ